MGNSAGDKRANNFWAGGKDAVAEIVGQNHESLLRLVRSRLDHRVKGRIDPSDVLQSALAEVTRRLPTKPEDPTLTPDRWLRMVVVDHLNKVHRDHLGRQKRDVRREVSLFRKPLPATSSAALAAQLLGQHTTPSQAALRAERLLRLEGAINKLDLIDRDLLRLIHLDELTQAEAAQELGLTPAAVAKRYVRALVELKELLGDEAS